MMVFIHMTAGLPARTPKLLAARQCNTELLRNLFIAEGYMMLLLTYHKQEWHMGTRAIARFMPPVVIDMLLKFLALVKPLARILH